MFDQDAGESGPPDPRAAQLGAGLAVSLERSTGVLAAGTFLSRVTGFVRVAVAVAILGIGGLGDAYNFANTVPNTVYDLVLGGVLSATLIPVFVDELERPDRHDGARAISAVLSAIGAALVVLSAALYLLAPLVVHLYLLLNHSALRGDELAVGTSLLRLFAPQVFFLGAIVVSTALLNARRQFAAAAFSPVVNNVIAVGALVATALIVPDLHIGAFRHANQGLVVLGLGTTLGYVAQLAVQVPAMARSGLRLSLVWAPRHPAVRRVAGLSAWLLGVVVANQVSYNLIVVLAARVPGGFTVYQTAYQFFQLPYSLFAVSIASAIMPDLAQRWSRGERVGFLHRLVTGLRVTLALLVPTAIGFALLAQPVVNLAVRHGQVHAASAHLLGVTLAAFALGLPGFAALLPLVRGLQAMKATKAMFVIYAFENALSVVGAVALYPSLGDRGLALAWAAPYTLAAIGAAWYLHRRVGHLGGYFTVRAIGRILLATAFMAAVIEAVNRVMPGGTNDFLLLAHLGLGIGGGALAYLAAARVVGISEMNVVLGPLRRRALSTRQGRRGADPRPPRPPRSSPPRSSPPHPPSPPAPPAARTTPARTGPFQSQVRRLDASGQRLPPATPPPPRPAPPEPRRPRRKR